MRRRRHPIEHSTQVRASAEAVWQHVTDVDIASFRHPRYFAVLGIPKPLRADLVRTGVGGVRIAYFDNGLRFTQEITAWEPHEQYAFTFRADPGFRVAHVLDLADGPFRMRSGAYRIVRDEDTVRLSLASEYELHGAAGAVLRVPVGLVLALFQRYLLRTIRANAERACHGRA